MATAHAGLGVAVGRGQACAIEHSDDQLLPSPSSAGSSGLTAIGTDWMKHDRTAKPDIFRIARQAAIDHVQSFQRH